MGTSFLGRFDYSIDAKGRVNIPAKFRKGLNPEAEETFVICRAPCSCLRPYPMDKQNNRQAELHALPETPERLKFKRHTYGTLSESTLDAQGRVSLTQVQMKLAEITKEVTLVGEGDYVEIWDTEKFNKYIGLDREDDGFDDAHFNIVKSEM